MNWVNLKERKPEIKGEYFVFENFISETETGPVKSKLLGIAWFNGERFCDVMTRWGEQDDEYGITHWAEIVEPES